MRSSRSLSSFSLIEILLVLIIIGVLMSAIVNIASFDQVRQNNARTCANNIHSMISETRNAAASSRGVRQEATLPDESGYVPVDMYRINLGSTNTYEQGATLHEIKNVGVIVDPDGINETQIEQETILLNNSGGSNPCFQQNSYFVGMRTAALTHDELYPDGGTYHTVIYNDEVFPNVDLFGATDRQFTQIQINNELIATQEEMAVRLYNNSTSDPIENSDASNPFVGGVIELAYCTPNQNSVNTQCAPFSRIVFDTRTSRLTRAECGAIAPPNDTVSTPTINACERRSDLPLETPSP